MKYRNLGRSGLQVSELCLGTMNFAARTSEKDAFDVLDAAIDAGINFIDTANQYGGSQGVGATEQLLGRWLAKRPEMRNRLIVASKVFEPMSIDVNDRGLSARHIEMACDASLKRLGLDRIDLYQMHHFDRKAPVAEIWQAMDRLIQQGKITYVGSSNFPGWGIAQTMEHASNRQSLGLVSEQSLYNLLERRVELEVLPACAEYGLGLIPWSPLAGGLLAGDSRGANGRRQSEQMQAKMTQHAEQLQAYARLCAELSESTSAVAIAWLLQQTAVSATIIGPADVSQLNSVLNVPELLLDQDVLRQLDSLFPPCGAAPEAYAW
ncbi:MAG: aldo/keto reductase [Pseudomonadota bacterium]